MHIYYRKLRYYRHGFFENKTTSMFTVDWEVLFSQSTVRGIWLETAKLAFVRRARFDNVSDQGRADGLISPSLLLLPIRPLSQKGNSKTRLAES